MPICERDPWRFQFFDKVACPEDVPIPTDDPDCWEWYPRHRWVYDKLRIAESQGLPCGPHGTHPADFPVFSKPVVNLKGMGIGGRVIHTASEFEHHHTAGHMWMPYFTGRHISTDCAVENGRVTWSRQATGESWIDGMFSLWTIHAEGERSIDAMISRWVASHMDGYTGMMNFETIGDHIIEVHLRFADQWCDLYGEGWVEALVRLYAEGNWTFDDSRRREGYSVPLFGIHGRRYFHPSAEHQATIRAMPDVASLQITFHEDRPPEDHPMPPGGFRLGIINCWNRDAGLAARLRLAEAFPAHAVLLPGEPLPARAQG